MYYEVTPWRTVGGISGKYELESPWDTPCELMLDQISGNIATTVVIGFDANDDLASVIANYATSTILTPGWRGMVIRVAANTPFPGNAVPIPIESRRIYVQILTDAAGACYCTAHFRRQAPDAGTYDHSRTTLEATVEMAGTPEQLREAQNTWGSNLSETMSSPLVQSYQPGRSPLRRHNSSKRQPGLLSKLAGK